MTEKSATKKAINKIKDGKESLPSKRFELCSMIRCPDCNAIMVTLDDSTYCTNTDCESLNVKYRIPTIVLQRK